MISPEEDAFGAELYAFHTGEDVFEIIEREDGYIDASDHNPGGYFAPFEDWPEPEKQAIAYARGRALDIGCGAGRVLLHLQEQGLEAVGLDNSPLAIQVCQERGARDARLCSITQTSRTRLGSFETIVMFGNNFGLLANPVRARWLLKRFYGMTGPDGRILAASNDIYQTENPLHLAYQASNRARERMSGQIRLRVRHGIICSPWFDYLMVSQEEMAEILRGTGWHIEKVFESQGPGYTVLLEKD